MGNNYDVRSQDAKAFYASQQRGLQGMLAQQQVDLGMFAAGCTEKKPVLRPSTATEVAAALSKVDGDYRRGSPQYAATPTSTLYGLRREALQTAVWAIRQFELTSDELAARDGCAKLAAT